MSASQNNYKYLLNLIETKIRKDGKNQKEVSLAMGITPAALSLILNNERAIGAETAVRIARYLDLPLAEVLHLANLDEFLQLITGIVSVNEKPSQYKPKTISSEDKYLTQIIDQLSDLTTNQLKIISDLAHTFRESNTPAPISDTDTPATYPTKRGKKQ